MRGAHVVAQRAQDVAVLLVAARHHHVQRLGPVRDEAVEDAPLDQQVAQVAGRREALLGGEDHDVDRLHEAADDGLRRK